MTSEDQFYLYSMLKYSRLDRKSLASEFGCSRRTVRRIVVTYALLERLRVSTNNLFTNDYWKHKYPGYCVKHDTTDVRLRGTPTEPWMQASVYSVYYNEASGKGRCRYYSFWLEHTVSPLDGRSERFGISDEVRCSDRTSWTGRASCEPHSKSFACRRILCT